MRITVFFFLLFFLTPSLFSQSIKSFLAGEVIGRNTRGVVLSKANAKMQDEKSWIHIPIKNNRFHYTLIAEHAEMYHLVFEEEFEAGTYTPIHFFPYNGNISFILHSYEEKDANIVTGGPLNQEYQDFLKSYTSSFKPEFAELSRKRDSLEKNNSFQRQDYRVLVKKWQAEKDLVVKQDLLKEMMERQKTGQALTDEGNSVNRATDSLSRLQAAIRHQYIRTHTSIPAFYLLEFDTRFSKNDRAAANTIAESFPRFAKAFPDHPYTQKIELELNGMLRIRAGEKLIDVSIPDINGNPQSVNKAIEGKIAVIDFWGSWCGPCIAKTRKIVPIYEAYKDRGFTIVNIAREYRSTREMEKRLKIEKWPWLQLVELDDRNKIWAKFGIADATGMMLLVNKEGIIVAVDPEPQEIEKFLKENG